MVVKRVPLQASTSNLLALKLFADINGDVIAHSGVKVGSFTRDLTAASGDQAITGVDFKPSAILVLANLNITNQVSVGFCSAANIGTCILYSVSESVWRNTSQLLYLTSVLGNTEQYAVLKTMDSDGFTVTWTKVGNPTGTATMYYLAFR